MNSKHYFTILLIFYFNYAIIANEYEDYSSLDLEPSSSLAGTEGLVSTIVGGSVSVITGEYVDFETDLVVPGPEPLCLQRSYSSNDFVSRKKLVPQNDLFIGWSLTLPSLINVAEVKASSSKRKFFASATVPSGARVCYKKWIHNGHGNEWTDYLFNLTKGFTNCGAGKISAATNLKNNHLRINTAAHLANLSTGDGTECAYTHLDSFGSAYFMKMIEERKLNHTLKTFEHIEEGFLRRVDLWNASKDKNYGTIKLKGIFGKTCVERVVATTSAGGKATFHFKRHRYKTKDGDPIDDYYLNKVENSERPRIEYQHIPSYHRNRHLLISEKRYEDNRFKKVDYYTKGSNSLGHTKVNIDKSNDKQIDRVSRLRAPVGYDETPITTYSFKYTFFDKNDVNSQGKKLGAESGLTEVFDAYGRKSKYYYNSEHRLKSIDRFTGKGSYHPYSSEVYKWGKKGTSSEGNLMAKWHVDHTIGKARTARFFTYDSKGNIIKDRQYGTVTSFEKPYVSIHNYKPVENGADCYENTYRYNHLNLLVQENETNGKGVYYAYHPNSNAINTKLVVDVTGKVHYREFNAYDESTLFLIKKIVDDGISNDPNSLEGVTSRKITYYVQPAEAPFGVPSKIIEKYLDLDSGEEVLLHQTVCGYNKKGFPIVQHHHDSENLHRYSLYWKYDSHNNVIEETNALGQVITRKYDANNNKIFEEGPSHDYYTKYIYDYSNRLVKEEQHHKDQIFSISYVYDYIGNCVAQTDIFGNETNYTYDDFNRLIKIEHPLIDTINGPVRPSEQYDYDSLGNKTLMVDALGNMTKTIYNIHAKPLHITHPDGTVEKYEYYPDGNLFKAYDKSGTCTLYTRDCFGRIQKEETVSPSGELLSQKSYVYQGQYLIGMTDEEGCHTSYRYDGAGRLIEEDKEGQKTAYGYDSFGRKNVITRFNDDQAHVTWMHYDFLGRILEERTQNKEGSVISWKKYAYDAVGNQTCIQDGNRYTYIEYDSLGKPIQIIDPENQKTRIVYDYNHINELGQAVLKTTLIDPNGLQTVEIQDAFGRLHRVRQISPYGTLLSQSTIFYDAVGNAVLQSEDIVVDGVITSNILRLCEYNSVQQMTKMVEALHTPSQRVVQYEYNSIGQLSSIIKPDGIQLNSTYDAKGRLLNFSSSDHTVGYFYHYNRCDQVTQVDDLAHNTQIIRRYDLLGRMEFEKLSNGLEVAYSYDKFDRPVQMSLPDGSSIQYHYDEHYLRAVNRGSLAHRYDQYDLYGNPTHHTLINGSCYERAYDGVNRIKVQHGSIYHQGLEYDPVGNLKVQAVIDPLGTYIAHYAYNELSQLTSEDGLENHTYGYDSLHNRISKDGTHCAFNSLNQILAQESSQFEYDLNGNLILKKEHGIEIRYAYDALDRLISVACNDTTTTFVYDAFNRRISKNDLLFFYEGQNEIGSFINNQIKELRVLGMGIGAEIGAAVLYELDGRTFYPLHDHNGNVATLVDLNGNAVETYRYSGFGIEITTASLNPWRFASKRFDPETNLVYFGRRYYDPAIGRWITADPEGYQDGPNLYAYVHNNPLSKYDLYGLLEGSGVTYADGFEDFYTYYKSKEDFWEKQDFYEEYHPYYEPSRLYDLGLPELPDGLEIGFINGMDNPFDTSKGHAMYASKLSGGYNIHCVYNADHGTINNLVECHLGLMNIATKPVRLLHERWDQFFAKAGPDIGYLQLATSQGMIHTKNALLDYSPELRKRIFVVGIAPGGYVVPGTCGDVMHYKAEWWKDLVPLFDRQGLKRAMSAGTITTLKSHPNAPFHDHSFQSPTFREVIHKHCNNYIKNRGRRM